MSLSSCDNPSFVMSAAASSAKVSPVQQEVMELFDEFRNPLLRYSLSLGLPVHDAEEVIQETFLALFRHLIAGKSRKNLRGWLFRVAHNLALKQRMANQSSLQRTAGDKNAAEEHADPAMNPEEKLTAAQRQYRLLAVVHALPEHDQRCLRLRAEGLRYREIAAVLGMSLGAVSISLTRSLARLVRADGR